MKKQLLILSTACLLLTSCEMDKNRGASAQQERMGTEMDRKTTESIRQSLMDDNTLSPQAKDVKIMTLDGVVTLKGNVVNEVEKSKIERKAKGVAGVKNVDNQLEVMVLEVPANQ